MMTIRPRSRITTREEMLRSVLPRNMQDIDLATLTEQQIARLERLAAVHDEDEPEHHDPRKFQTITVAHPRLEGATERVAVTLDTIELMHRRKHLTDEQYHAAVRIRMAHDCILGCLGGAMDFERVRGGGSSNKSPPAAALEAYDDLQFAKSAVGDNWPLVEMVVCQAMTIDAAARKLFANPSFRTKKTLAKVMKDALTNLAERWFRINRQGRHKFKPFHTPDADPKTKPYTTDIVAFDRDATAHASRRGVKTRKARK